MKTWLANLLKINATKRVYCSLLLLVILACAGCNSTKIRNTNRAFFTVHKVRVERVFAGIPSESVAYRIYIETEIQKKGNYTFTELQWGNFSVPVFEWYQNEMFKKVDFERTYKKGQNLTLYASLSNVEANRMPETLWKSEGEQEISPMILTCISSKNRQYRAQIKQIENVQNYYAK